MCVQSSVPCAGDCIGAGAACLVLVGVQLGHGIPLATLAHMTTRRLLRKKYGLPVSDRLLLYLGWAPWS
jgi:hypothetical protein